MFIYTNQSRYNLPQSFAPPTIISQNQYQAGALHQEGSVSEGTGLFVVNPFHPINHTDLSPNMSHSRGDHPPQNPTRVDENTYEQGAQHQQGNVTGGFGAFTATFPFHPPQGAVPSGPPPAMPSANNYQPHLVLAATYATGAAHQQGFISGGDAHFSITRAQPRRDRGAPRPDRTTRLLNHIQQLRAAEATQGVMGYGIPMPLNPMAPVPSPSVQQPGPVQPENSPAAEPTVSKPVLSNTPACPEVAKADEPIPVPQPVPIETQKQDDNAESTPQATLTPEVLENAPSKNAQDLSAAVTPIVGEETDKGSHVSHVKIRKGTPRTIEKRKAQFLAPSKGERLRFLRILKKQKALASDSLIPGLL